MQYQRIAALVADSAAEVAAARLALAGFSVEVLDQTTLEKPPPGRVGLVVYSPLEGGVTALGEVCALFERAGIAAEVATSVSDEAAWRDAWKAYFMPRPVGRFVIVPSWESYHPAPGETVLELDPGRAFGTGGHASTRLCLRAIDELAECRRFLDVGCGSGVLAIACARLWPGATGAALDTDPEAVEVTRENAVKNGVAARIEASTTPLAQTGGCFDLVLANIQAEVIAALASELAARVEPGGRLIASGILIEQAGGVRDALAAHGLALVPGAQRDEDEWCALTLARAERG